ncbi:hypothetical protein [Delftia tsuruhatensis]|uniref:hypothetical protein n=1 Tax=Delftia tsuruhatensis TaxID=180282 RepID=UPI0008E2D543|nr:hypothetical protein [Delftia tsuruhatensis]SFB29148.1 hypothetical protein SAMN05444579_103586 [Delftia tsuruhatensis]
MTVIKIEDVITFGKNPLTKKEQLNFKKNGVSFINKIKGLKENGYLDTEPIKDLTFTIDSTKKGILLEISYKEEKEITLKDGTKKNIRITEYVFVDYEDKTLNVLHFSNIKPTAADKQEMSFYQ